MTALDDAADLFVWPTRGEAFGLLPLKKFARGMSALVTDWSGIRSYRATSRDTRSATTSWRRWSTTTSCATWPTSTRRASSGSCASGPSALELRRRRRELSERAVALWDERRTTFPAARRALEEVLTDV